MLKEKIVHMRVHQVVNFEGSLVSYFSSVGGPGRTAAKMTLLPEISCVLCEGPKDKALVPLVNVAFLKLESESFQKKQKEIKEEAAKPKNNPKLNKVSKPR